MPVAHVGVFISSRVVGPSPSPTVLPETALTTNRPYASAHLPYPFPAVSVSVPVSVSAGRVKNANGVTSKQSPGAYSWFVTSLFDRVFVVVSSPWPVKCDVAKESSTCRVCATAVSVVSAVLLTTAATRLPSDGPIRASPQSSFPRTSFLSTGEPAFDTRSISSLTARRVSTPGGLVSTCAPSSSAPITACLVTISTAYLPPSSSLASSPPSSSPASRNAFPSLQGKPPDTRHTLHSPTSHGSKPASYPTGCWSSPRPSSVTGRPPRLSKRLKSFFAIALYFW
mmetsp:Transcript_13016/g.43110  ORF Transcript_13016/g.43110 Transcript_13016/m.43110 type:complete len:283 (-) Transcript_13016:363-1211(-)